MGAKLKSKFSEFIVPLIILLVCAKSQSQRLQNDSQVIYVEVQRGAQNALIPCKSQDADSKGDSEIILFQNGARSARIGTSKDSSYDPSKGFTVKVPPKLPLTGISYECRTFPKKSKVGVRLLPSNVSHSESRPEPWQGTVQTFPKETVELNCSTTVESWTPLTIVHDIDQGISGCESRAEGSSIKCSVHIHNETSGGQYHCIQQNSNDSNLFGNQIVSSWTIDLIPERVNVTIVATDDLIACTSTLGATPSLEYCQCTGDEDCAVLQGKLENVPKCMSASKRDICKVVEVAGGTQTNASSNLPSSVSSSESKRTAVATDTLNGGQHIFRCFAVAPPAHINCDHAFKKAEISRVGRTTLIIIIVLVVALLLLAVLGIFVYRHKFLFHKFRVEKLTEQEVDEFLNGNQTEINAETDINDQAHLLPYDSKFEFPKGNLHFEKQLGAGAYGTVMRARAEGLTDSMGKSILTVAVKTIPPSSEMEYFRAILVELKIMMHIGSHQNVVNLLGAVTEKIKSREVYLIVEYCRFGDLHGYLVKNGKKFVNQLVKGKIDPTITKNASAVYGNIPHPVIMEEPESPVYANTTVLNREEEYQNLEMEPMDTEFFGTMSLLSWAYQAAQGMAYLDTKKVLHGDLAARNILLADDGVVKIADFGLARQVYKNPEYQKTQRQKLPIKWMAPESLTRLVFSTKSDVWSYGITLNEFFTLGEVPYPGTDVGEAFLEQLQRGYRMKQAKLCPNEIYNLMILCWHSEPEARPSFHDITTAIGRLLMDLNKDHYSRLSQWGSNK